jgi:hypothetical protein
MNGNSANRMWFHPFETLESNVLKVSLTPHCVCLHFRCNNVNNNVSHPFLPPIHWARTGATPFLHCALKLNLYQGVNLTLLLYTLL